MGISYSQNHEEDVGKDVITAVSDQQAKTSDNADSKDTVEESKSPPKKDTTKSVASRGVFSYTLVNGYIRELQSDLSWNFVPIDVIILCTDFYCARIILIYMNQGVYSQNVRKQEPFELCITDFNETSRKYDAVLHKHDLESSSKRMRKRGNKMVNAKIFFSKNINLPSNICSELDYNEKTQFDVIFRHSDGMADYSMKSMCNALIWKSNVRRHGNRDKTLNIIDYELPESPKYMRAANIIYSQRYSTLYTIGGMSDRDPTVAKLDLTVDHGNWQWQSIDTQKLGGIRFGTNTSCILMDTGFDGEEIWSLLTNDIDGYRMKIKKLGLSQSDDQLTTSIMDTECDLPQRRHNAIIHDKLGGKIFIGGGHSSNPDLSGHSVGYLDFEKQKWYGDIPMTLMKHNHFPILWKDGELLYIASVKSEGIEWIDLRVNENKEWNMYTDTLNTYFDKEIHGYNAYRCRLLR